MSKKTQGTALGQIASGTSLDLDTFDIPEAPALRENRHYDNLLLQGKYKVGRRYVDCHFSNVTLEECHFGTLHFERCVMDNVRLVACNISEFKLIGCDIQGLVATDCLVNQCLFQEGKQRQVIWRNGLIDGISFNQLQVESLQIHGVSLARWSAAASSFSLLEVRDSEFSDAGWFNSRLQVSRWRGGVVRRQAMSGCTLTEVDYQGTNGSHLVWNDCTLSQVNLAKMPLQSASFLGANLSKCDMSGCNLSQAAFTRAQLSDCRLNNANLTFCQAEDVSFVACDLSGACMHNAHLNGALLVQCRVDGSDFTGADLRAAEVRDTSFHAVIGCGEMRVHGARGPVTEGAPTEPLLIRIDAWYQLNQPGLPEASPLSSGKPLKGGSRYV
ncbi:Serine/threonine-protein kinase B [Serratia ficaria]|uniref:pentapeptide repeat-containing protein n=1 Tax=Serratia ficaria TaxID=61651 RepID=UPI002177B85C|nr:pentapeptide repeat-containing protein [Serratia ficaria]CAI1706600.1 Serine/threonine-protein kinase B [Serratia ficaria]